MTLEIGKISAVDWSQHAVFLDLDGTLAPIVEIPSQAAIAAETLAAVRTLGEKAGGALAVLSGRRLCEIDRLLSPLTIPAAGSHGAERRTPTGEIGLAIPEPDEFDLAAAEIEDFARRHDLFMERKSGAVSLHYRSAPALAEHCMGFIDGLIRSRASMRAIHGKMVSELAVAQVDKGKALEIFMQEHPFLGRAPIAAGDDTTDEDAFAAAEALGGFGIKIGAGPTAASVRAADIERFLNWLHAAAAG